LSLRLLEFTVRDDEVEIATEVLENQQIHHVWTAGSADGTTAIRVLLDAEGTEPVTDALLERLGHRDECRMVLLPVEATVPRIEEPEKDDGDTPAGSDEGEETDSRPTPSIRISREELYEDLASGTRLTLSYAIMVFLSTVVAAVGLIRNDVAIIIGAMVIAPLLGPNIALSFASTLGDSALARRALTTMAAGFVIAGVVSVALGMVLDVDPAAPEIAARTSASLGNIALALAAGAAGSLAFTTGVPAVLVGVMVAVALLPPLTTAGLLAGGGQWQPARGALLLLLTNIASINLAAMGTFLAHRIQPRTWWEAERAKKARRVTIVAWAITLVVLAGLIALEGVGTI
jgi:uncharacterized hydrophobic protein (TIGR00341 family)